ncbi:hypothetical protein ACLOJK_007320 [Asimina triloba]
MSTPYYGAPTEHWIQCSITSIFHGSHSRRLPHHPAARPHRTTTAIHRQLHTPSAGSKPVTICFSSVRRHPDRDPSAGKDELDGHDRPISSVAPFAHLAGDSSPSMTSNAHPAPPTQAAAPASHARIQPTLSRTRSIRSDPDEAAATLSSHRPIFVFHSTIQASERDPHGHPPIRRATPLLQHRHPSRQPDLAPPRANEPITAVHLDFSVHQQIHRPSNPADKPICSRLECHPIHLHPSTFQQPWSTHTYHHNQRQSPKFLPLCKQLKIINGRQAIPKMRLSRSTLEYVQCVDFENQHANSGRKHGRNTLDFKRHADFENQHADSGRTHGRSTLESTLEYVRHVENQHGDSGRTHGRSTLDFMLIFKISMLILAESMGGALWTFR